MKYKHLDVPVVTVEGQDLYELMQVYRHSPISQQDAVVTAYKGIVDHLDSVIQPLIASTVTLRNEYAVLYNMASSEDAKKSLKDLIEGIDAHISKFSIK